MCKSVKWVYVILILTVESFTPSSLLYASLTVLGRMKESLEKLPMNQEFVSSDDCPEFLW